MKVELEIEDTVKRTVRGARTSGRVHVPKEWIGKDVQICLLLSDSEQEKKDARY